MIKHPSAIKRNRQSLKRKDRNRAIKSEVKTQVKSTLASIQAGNPQEVETDLRKTQKLLMKAASKRVIKKRTASRKISRLARKSHAASVSSSQT